jgi:hypothetical protein
MSKDPAFLFYSNDFLTGTYLMSDEQVGKYIRILCLQHQKGSLNEKDMLKICKTYDEDIFAKFKKEGDLYYNTRLKEETEKRKSYSESRKNNRKKKDMLNICKTYVPHMENENENENEIVNNIILKGKKYLNSDFNDLPEQYIISSIEQIKIQKQQTISKDQVAKLWETFKLEKLTGEDFYQSESKVYQYFVNWIKKQKFEKNETRTNQERTVDAYNQFLDRYR